MLKLTKKNTKQLIIKVLFLNKSLKTDETHTYIDKSTFLKYILTSFILKVCECINQFY